MNKQPKIKFITLGCRVNQYETQGMREALRKAGAVPVRQDFSAEPVDFVVVNTCTVTADADRENRYWIRRARREHPQARVIVTGCGVQKNRADYEALPEVDQVLGNDQKHQVANFLEEGCAAPTVQENFSGVYPRPIYTPLSISETEGYGRAFVKIQDGCNHVCSFCKVVQVRGRSRSRELQDILDEVTRLRDSGYREIVFAGIQLGAYGLDFMKSERSRLVEVLEACHAIDGIDRLRLSSIEPTDVKPSLIKTLRDLPKCCHQLHIPLQSGDDEILKRMNRRYASAFYRDLIERLRAAMPDFCLTLDVMAGFPGETEDHFENTVNFTKTVRPLKCHVFPYSRREGTRAAQFPDLPPASIRERVKKLILLGESLGAEIKTSFLGKKIPVLVESYDAASGLAQGLTAHFVKVYFPSLENSRGQFVPVKLLTLHADGILGSAEQEVSWTL